MSRERPRRPVLGISAGDPSGIGPEVLKAALALPRVRRALLPLVFGDASLRKLLPGYELRSPGTLARPRRPTLCAVTRLSPTDRRPGHPRKPGGRAQLAYVQAALEAAKAGRVDALCTAPVSKESITRAGIPFMGHTEFLAEAFGVETLMLMEGPRLKVALATNHLPIRALSGALNPGRLARQLLLLSRSLAPRLGRRPRIAVCGFNPHAGEGGLLGDEERTSIVPAIARARRQGVLCEGPLAADGLFAKMVGGVSGFDAVLAMFHDQGLIAAKTADFDRTVNVTLGLPLPRTSPGHGVAYDIAGRGRADPRPMAEALLKAAELARAS